MVYRIIGAEFVETEIFVDVDLRSGYLLCNIVQCSVLQCNILQCTAYCECDVIYGNVLYCKYIQNYHVVAYN